MALLVASEITLHPLHIGVEVLVTRDIVVAELIAYFICMLQVSGSRLRGYETLSTELLSGCHHNSIIVNVPCMCGRSGKDLSIRSDPIKVGSCLFQCNVSHQWIAQWQVSPVSVYCDGVGCHVLCLRHGIPVWQHIVQSTTATSRYRIRSDITSDVLSNIIPQQRNLVILWSVLNLKFN